MAIKVNDDVGNYFQTKKGLRQGAPISPMLFNIAVDMLAILVERAKVAGQISGVIPHLVEEVCLFYNMRMTLFSLSIMT